jgi:hypothetical protein
MLETDIFGADSVEHLHTRRMRVLVAQNRANPFTRDELCRLHEIKRTFRERLGAGNGS